MSYEQIADPPEFTYVCRPCDETVTVDGQYDRADRQWYPATDARCPKCDTLLEDASLRW